MLRRAAAPLGVVFAALLAWQPLPAGAAPTAYGQRFVRVDQAAVPPDQSGVEVAPADDQRTVRAEYERQLTELEQRGGPYAASLAEPLAGLAGLRAQQGDIVGSRRLYERALHLVRVNDGLYSERQVPILRQLFDSYRSSGDMESLDARYDYYFRLYGAGQPPYTPMRLRAALEYLRWQHEALLLGLEWEQSGRLLALLDLNGDLLTAVAADSAVPTRLYKALVMSQLNNLYLLQDMYRPELQSRNEPPKHLTAAAWEPQDTNEYRLELLQRKAVSTGRELLEELVARTPPGQSAELAELYLQLGDWSQWNDRRSEAEAAYRQVVALLAQAGEQARLEQWLGAPQELPANGVFRLPDATDDEAVVVAASFEVSARGRAQNIETTVANEEDEDRAGRLRRDLAGTRFRPAYPGGEPGDSGGVSRRYEVFR